MNTVYLYTIIQQEVELLMPTLLRSGPYRFFIYSIDCQEPIHVHVERDDKVAKFWLTPIRLQTAGGFRSSEINRIHRLIESRYRFS